MTPPPYVLTNQLVGVLYRIINGLDLRKLTVEAHSIPDLNLLPRDVEERHRNPFWSIGN